MAIRKFIVVAGFAAVWSACGAGGLEPDSKPTVPADLRGVIEYAGADEPAATNEGSETATNPPVEATEGAPAASDGGAQNPPEEDADSGAAEGPKGASEPPVEGSENAAEGDEGREGTEGNEGAGPSKPGDFVAPVEVICPGDPSCPTGDDAAPYRAGFGIRTINPAIETFVDKNDNGLWNKDEPFEDMNGNGEFDPYWMVNSTGRLARGVNDDIHTRVAVLEKGATRIAFIGLDTFGYFLPDVNKIRKLAHDAGLAIDYLVVSSAHNHNVTDTVGIYGEAIGKTGYKPEYISEINAQTLAALQDAVAALEDVELTFARNLTHDLIEDTRLPVVLDENIYLIQFKSVASGKTIGTLVNWGNHVESVDLDSTLVSADQNKGIFDTIEGALGGTCVYMQGMVGGLMTSLRKTVTGDDGKEIPKGSYESAFRIGELAARFALDGLENDPLKFSSTNGELSVHMRKYKIPFQNIGFRVMASTGALPVDQREAFLDDGTVIKPKDQAKLAQSEYDNRIFTNTESAVINIDQAQFITVPGEMYPELVLLQDDGSRYLVNPQDPGADYLGAEEEPVVMEKARDTHFRSIIGVANDFLGYIIPKRQWDQARPYAYAKDEPQYGEINSLGPDAAGAICGAIRGLLEEDAKKRPAAP